MLGTPACRILDVLRFLWRPWVPLVHFFKEYVR
jgi:hypothetical protein